MELYEAEISYKSEYMEHKEDLEQTFKCALPAFGSSVSEVTSYQSPLIEWRDVRDYRSEE